MKYIKRFGMFVEIVDGEIMAYNEEKHSGVADLNSVGILREANSELSPLIMEALDIDDLSEYNVVLPKDDISFEEEDLTSSL